jgi:hypothetical protein
MLVPRVYSVKRVLVTGWPFVILFVAWLVAQLHERRVRSALLAISLALTLGVVFFLPKDDWRGAVAYVDRSVAGDQTLVWLDPRWNHYPYEYYQPRLSADYGRVEDLAALAATARDIWLIAERYHGLPVPSSPSESWLNQNWELVDQMPYYRLEVRHYQPVNP